MLTPPDEQVRAGQIARDAIALAKTLCKSTIDGKTLDKEIEQFIRDEGGTPALKGYQPPFVSQPYQWTICLAVNNDVVHGVPTKLVGSEVVVTVDLVVGYKGWHADTARTFTNSEDPYAKNFVEASRLIFDIAKEVISPNQPLAVFGSMVQRGAEVQGYGIIREYCGHGIGRNIHTEPNVLNYQTDSQARFEIGKSYAVEPVLAIKPEYNLKHSHTIFDAFSVTADCLTSHNEDTIFIGKNKVFNLTGEAQ